MNYTACYQRLIDRAQARTLTGYKERHHIIPRCIGGDNSSDNLVDLTAEEHFVAHQLLVKIYPESRSLVHAVLLMSKRATGNKAFGWLRRRKAEAMRGNLLRSGTKLSSEHIQKLVAINKGRKQPRDAVERTAAAHRGKTLSKETREKISAARTGKPLSEEHKNKVSMSLLGNKRTLGYKASEETRKKMSAARLGVKRGPMSPETKAKISAANKGKSRDLEARMKMSESRKGKPKTPEHRANIAAAHLMRIREKNTPNSSNQSLTLF